MIFSRVFIILKTFRLAELKSFHVFLQSKFFNTNRNLLNFYLLLIKYHPTYNSEELTNEMIYKEIFGDKEYVESSVKNLFSYLLTVLENYLVTYNIVHKTMERNFILLEELKNRNINFLVEKTLDDLNSELGKMKADSSYYFDKYRFNVERFNYIANNELIANEDKLKLETDSLRDSAVNLVKYFTLNMTNAFVNSIFYDVDEITCDTRKMFKNFMLYFDIKKLNGIISVKDKNDFILELYDSLADAFLNIDDEKKYYMYKETINKYADKLSLDEISFHYSTLIGYSVMKNIRNIPGFQKELLDLYTDLLDNEYYKDKKTSCLLPMRYRDILISGIDMGKYEWAYNFIEKYTHCLPDREAENMYSWAKAYYYFSAGDFDMALENMGKIEFEHFIFKYDVFNIKLKIFFDKGNYETVLNMIRTFRKALNTDNLISKERSTRYRNFLHYISRAIQYLYKYRRIDIDYLLEELKEKDNIYSKPWLLERYAYIIRKPVSRYSSMV